MNNFSKLVYCKVFLANVNSFALCRRASVCPSVVCRLSVCLYNVRAPEWPYSADWNFRRYFCAI